MRVHCDEQLRNQAWSRNAAAAAAAGTTLAFIDADDTMVPEKLRRVADAFGEHRPALVVHAFEAPQGQSNGVAEGLRIMGLGPATLVVHGETLWDSWKAMERRRSAVVMAGIMHSQPTVRAEVMRGDAAVLYRTASRYFAMEDAWFLKDVLRRYGRDNRTACFLNANLGTWVANRASARGRGGELYAEPNEQVGRVKQLALALGGEAASDPAVVSRIELPHRAKKRGGTFGARGRPARPRAGGDGRRLAQTLGLGQTRDIPHLGSRG
jgi:glycosyltransferase involved in cell wall biosynthesis